MKTLIIAGIACLLVGTILMVFAYAESTQEKPFIVAWYDMNGDKVIDMHDFDLDGNGIVNWVDVQLVINAKNVTYVERYDFNRDNVVDDTDVEIVRAWIGSGTMALYDMNGDGIVTWKDLDVTYDGKVDICDVVTVACAYNTTSLDDNFNPRCDFNQDGKINDIDLNLIKPYFGYPLSLFSLGTFVGQSFILGLAVFVMGVLFVSAGIVRKTS